MSLTTSALPATATPLGYDTVRAVGALPGVPVCASSLAATDVKLRGFVAGCAPCAGRYPSIAPPNNGRMAGMMTDAAIKNGARRSWIRTVSAPAIVAAVLAAALLAPACGGGASSNGPRDAGLDGSDSAAVVVEAPDLRFKWVGAGLAMHFVGFTNLGTALSGTYTEHGPLGVTPLELSGEVSSEYRVFSVANLEPMIFTATTNRLPGIDADLAQAVNSARSWSGSTARSSQGYPEAIPTASTTHC